MGHTIPLQRRWIFLKTSLKAFTEYVDFTRREESAKWECLSTIGHRGHHFKLTTLNVASSKLFLLVA